MYDTLLAFFLSASQGEQGLRGLPGPVGKPGPAVSVHSVFYFILSLSFLTVPYIPNFRS